MPMQRDCGCLRGESCADCNPRHTCILDDGGTALRKCKACEKESRGKGPRELSFAGIGIVLCEDGDCKLYCGRCVIGPSRRVEQLRRRDGDQPLPGPSDGPAMQDLVIADIEARKQIGIQRYGQTLKAHDGRDNLLDIYQELLDAAIYIRKEMYRRDGR